jgi:NMD protein affecting ribosome stability and mRNA decay
MKCRCLVSGIINIQTRRHCAYCRLKKCFDIRMRKDWIRTNEEVELRQLQKLAKEQKKLNQLADVQEYLLNLPIVTRKKKRLKKKPTSQELIVKPVNINNRILQITVLYFLDFWI